MKNWQANMAIWGYHVEGVDGIAMMAEQTGARTICGKVWWDRDRYGLKDEWINRGNGWEPVPEFWALPAVTDFLLKSGGPSADTGTSSTTTN